MRVLVVTHEPSTRGARFFQINNLPYAELVPGIDGKTVDYQWLKRHGYDTRKDWRTYGQRRMTHGEIGCALSHIKAWELCVMYREPCIIFEDDAVLQPNFDIEHVKNNLKHMLLLGFRHVQPPHELTSEFDVPTQWVNAHAYALIPEVAEDLLAKLKGNIFPVDDFMSEYLPESDWDVRAYKEEVVKQIPRSEAGTTTEPASESDYFVDFKTHIITVATNPDRAERLFTSAAKFKIKFKNLGHDVVWNGGDMQGPGGGQKVNLLRTFLAGCKDHDVVLFCDGYDVVVNDDLGTILGRYLGFHKEVLFAAERDLWPDHKLGPWPETETPYRYLNSGLFIGTVSELKNIVADELTDNADDQEFYQRKFLSGAYSMALDYEAYIFNCHEPKLLIQGNKQFLNPLTKTCPCIYHGNGGLEAKGKIHSIYKGLSRKDIAFRPITYQKISDDMLVVPFMSKAQCRELIEIADAHGGWQSLAYDKFPAQEIRVNKLSADWAEAFNAYWDGPLKSILEAYWQPLLMYGLRDAFVMRYSMDTQRNLALHTDASLVTGSVKLNDDYEGAELVFPRQGFSNKDIPVGHMVIFPGQVTHGHRCEELKGGVKYSLTFWTKRFSQDMI